MRRLVPALAVLLFGLGCAPSPPVEGPGGRTGPATAVATGRAPSATAPDDAVVPGPGAGQSLATPTNAPRHVAPQADTAVEGRATGVVRGRVTDVQTAQSGPVERLRSFALRGENGVAWAFMVQGNPGIDGPHAREHRDSGQPVTVTYLQADEGLIALRVDD